MSNERQFKSITMPPAHRTYKVGEEVSYGGHDKAVVVEASEDGRLYDLEVSNDRKKSYQTEPVIETELRKDVAWVSLLPISAHNDDHQEPFSDQTYYPLSYMQQDINSLLGRCYDHYEGVDFEPDYQRGHVWDMVDKVALIDSILAKRDIGKFVFNQRPYSDEGPLEEIVDGKQRLTAIKEFYEDRFKYRGLYYSQLNPLDRMTFNCKAVSVAVLQEASREEILKTFLAVNITGRQQNLDHIEHVRSLLEGE